MMRFIFGATFAVCLVALAAADSLSRLDEKFLNEFAQVNAAAVVAGRFAADNAQDPDVKALGRLMADDHGKVLEKIAQIGRDREFDVNAKPGVADKGKELLLEHRGESKFDEAYVESQIDAHEAATRMLYLAINEAQDAGIKQFASQMLPTVQHHLEMAKQLHARLAVSAALQ